MSFAIETVRGQPTEIANLESSPEIPAARRES